MSPRSAALPAASPGTPRMGATPTVAGDEDATGADESTRASDWLRLVGAEFWMVALTPFYLGYVVGSREMTGWPAVTGGAAVICLTAATFVLNNLADRHGDAANPRKRYNRLALGRRAKGRLTPRAATALWAALLAAALALGVGLGDGFVACMAAVALLAMAYSVPPLRLKSRPGLDVLTNGAGPGFLLPLAGWSLTQPLAEFPVLFFLAVTCYLMGLYAPTTVADREADRAAGVRSFAVVHGAQAAMVAGWLGTVAGVALMWVSGLLEIFPWDRPLLAWTGWILLAKVWVHWRVLPPRGPVPDYAGIFRGSIILATVEAVPMVLFLALFISGTPSLPL